MRVHQSTWGRVSQAQADVQTNYGIFCAHVQWFSHWKIKADNCDVMK